MLSFDACKRGFLAACRPVIFIDGCHLKTEFGGVLLTAIGMDPNDCIYPVAFAVVQVENTKAWRWFLTVLKEDLGIVDTSLWTVMSDKQKVSTCHCNICFCCISSYYTKCSIISNYLGLNYFFTTRV